MSSGKILNKLAAVCLEYAKLASTDRGQVDIEKLCYLFNAELIFRPLLVEGKIGKREGVDKWTVLIDSETFPEDALKSKDHSLHQRLRNTIAHELVHTLSFRLDEYGVSSPKKGSRTYKEFISSIEKETEKLSPLLLIPSNAFDSLNSSSSISDFVSFIDKYGVSRFVLIQRISWLRRLNEDRSFRNFAIGRFKGNKFEEWPLYMNFENAIIPSFLYEIRDKKPILISNVFEGHPVNGTYTEMEVLAGTDKTRNSDPLTVRFSTENKSEGLFIVQLPIDDKDELEKTNWF